MMSEQHGRRFEDLGIGRVLRYWPILVLIFTAGAWYQTSISQAALIRDIRRDTDDVKTRVTRVEDAVIYLKELVALKRAESRRER